MTKLEAVVRIFNLSDAIFLEKVQLILTFLTEDLALFHDFDADFSQEYVDLIAADIKKLQNMPTANQLTNDITNQTNVVLALMDDAKKKTQNTKYFIEKIAVKPPRILNEFGFDIYDSVHNSQPKMLQFLKKFNDAVKKYSAPLLEVGFTQSKADEIFNLTEQLDTANTLQEKLKSQRTVIVDDRILLMNKIWRKIMHVCDASEQVFENDYARQKRYIIYNTPNGQPPAGTATGVITGLITASSSGLPLKDAVVTVEVAGATLTATTDTEGEYALPEVPVGSYTVTATLGGYTTATRENVEVMEDEDTTCDFELKANG